MTTLPRNRRLFARAARTSRKAWARLRPALDELEVRITPSTLGMTSVVEGFSTGSDSVLVNTNGPWSAVPSPDAFWLHTSSVGNGSGLATFSFDPNPFNTRVGTLAIAGQTLTVTQTGSDYIPANPLTTLAATGLNTPSGVAVDDSGNVYIADTANNAVEKWTRRPGRSPPWSLRDSSAPGGVAVDSLAQRLHRRYRRH